MYAIAGVTGHVGSVAANGLLAKGERIRVIVRDEKKGEEWSKRGAEVAVASVDDEARMTAALRGAKGLFVLIPPNFATPDFYAWQRQVGTAVANAVKAAGVPHVVLLSSVGADLAEGNGPIKGLHHFENALRASGTVLTALRAGYFQENVANTIAAARQAGIVPNFMGPADAAMPMVATQDVGEVVAERLLARPTRHEVLDVHGPSYSVRQIAEKIGAALGKPLQIVDIPKPGWVPALKQAGMPDQFAEMYAEMFDGFASGRIVPKGDRMIQGKTGLDDTLKKLLA